MNIRSDSTEFGVATITADHDLTGKVVEVALPATGTDPATWYVAEVTDVAALGTGSWKLTYRLLIGPSGSATLAAGTYDWIVKITDTPEIPVRVAGTVTVS